MRISSALAFFRVVEVFVFYYPNESSAKAFDYNYIKWFFLLLLFAETKGTGRYPVYMDLIREAFIGDEASIKGILWGIDECVRPSSKVTSH